MPAVTAGWARWAPRSTPKPTSSCAGETTSGKKRRCLLTAPHEAVTVQNDAQSTNSLKLFSTYLEFGFLNVHVEEHEDAPSYKTPLNFPILVWRVTAVACFWLLFSVKLICV